MILGAEDKPNDFPAWVGSADLCGSGGEGLDADGGILLVPAVALGADLVVMDLGGIDEAGDGVADVAEDIAGADFFALEALDRDELERVDGQVADGEVGHGGGCVKCVDICVFSNEYLIFCLAISRIERLLFSAVVYRCVE